MCIDIDLLTNSAACTALGSATIAAVTVALDDEAMSRRPRKRRSRSVALIARVRGWLADEFQAVDIHGSAVEDFHPDDLSDETIVACIAVVMALEARGRV